ncbi:CocE/NonD family hydrolase [Rhodoplanes sp. TEM]|uniref:CocE/NonD family hydrolase n=1 Tax=Rhodoplanes tepidamans TaxID=200616 RepID=A0ABT5JB89_RHOTP|nr:MULTISPECIES: CocE/NonD family hydrolase [Rhodoplanes]MDC7786867.1 CocE/NonD family hydrolase [Rhodoplanes tepidamans]MDC7984204.1 CocE/NonD family hydrolase [Rhodoplanes sp. TEM]MDQ0355995.1 putative acyl esterase [Rhodoplanes tepidamans]
MSSVLDVKSETPGGAGTAGGTSSGIRVERNVDVPVRDGARLKADVLRPDADGRFPALLNLGPYQKDKVWIPPENLEEKPNPLMNWETVNPEWWVPRGYACVRIDARGTGKSPGRTQPWSLQESLDYCDAIEWAAAQPWCNGKVGLIGISYFAINQWFVANHQPPSLAAIVPWEGFADLYRDALFHGGILNQFMTNWFVTHLCHHLIGRAYRDNPDTFTADTLWRWVRHNLDTGAFAGEQAQWDRITVPLFSVGNWSGMGLHLRGNTEGFMRAASRHKKLRMHSGTHVHPFYTEEARGQQLRFLDHFLKGVDNGVMDEPPVRLFIRHGNGEGVWRDEHEWPLARTQWTRMYLDLSAPKPGAAANSGSLVPEKPAETSHRTYNASGASKGGSASASSTFLASGAMQAGMGITLDTAPFAEDTEITGPVAATLWVSSATEDMDLFLTIRDIDPDGNDVWEVGQQGQQVPIAKGWLRVSHRELDPTLSTPWRPYHRHARRLYLEPGEIVKVEVEIWPTSMVFRKRHRLRLDIQPRDGVGSVHYTHYHADYNTGTNTIYSGGDKESFLLLPVIPAR